MFKEYEARCIWPNGDIEVVVVETNMGRQAAQELVEQKLLSDYEPGGQIQALDVARPLFYSWSAG